ncbi:hypothetical protein WJ0W_000092 [Paenibacillus melissococcoides]|uniref:Alcohol dehydrogenase n=2 Tax=Paenibacillus TaxID=44249 RepID=A0ABN8TW27_9BACL|nr:MULTISPECIES: hypothetical protein [Paenibacillus]MEB9896666.1 hypothetical protein [Bacillus cereus]CAH8242883.1 hypothetical protein WJ0W_000092 [Paenibacillus melissococcoides]CAH8703325.1 hypothetical protein WDD9_000090 [Paenibacillus melissococcoides]CAH8706147.1 hypothetical protein HTL2_001174 [Paenibacillus melissococcoides]GIO82684.1 hypothetical protein J6TS7_62940 [Paenibacillus dendritiformis]
MAEFVRQLEAGRIRLNPLITHEYAIDDAPAAYEALHADMSGALGVLLRYDS